MCTVMQRSMRVLILIFRRCHKTSYVLFLFVYLAVDCLRVAVSWGIFIGSTKYTNNKSRLRSVLAWASKYFLFHVYNYDIDLQVMSDYLIFFI